MARWKRAATQLEQETRNVKRTSVTDEEFMRLALKEARKGLGKTSPNPAVGAVIVQGGRVVAKGYHRRAGLPHAEIEALRRLPDSVSARGGTLYVTLEPCSTHGRTPPCTEAIIAAALTRVVIGSIDPNPRHQGSGVRQLRRAGVSVSTGVLAKECADLNAGYNRWIRSGRPWVIAKVAQSIDGHLTRPSGEPQWLTNERSRRLVHRLRSTVDAILVGAETIRADDPQLTVHTGSSSRQPWRVIVTRSGSLPANARVFTDEFRDRTLVYRKPDWDVLLSDLGQRGITRLLVEGGGDVLGQLLDAGFIDEVWCFFAPLLTGGDKPSFGGTGVQTNEEAIDLADARFRKIGSDFLVVGRVRR
jgi:diaminohydroxyphosphoribosylaminopyrimidine deaminase/5-amino-6-(5-phosphoribosylamino)uracil reductase